MRPDLQRVISRITAIHIEIRTLSRGTSVFDSYFTVVVDALFSELLSGFREVVSFSLAGMIQATLDTELLYQVLAEYLSKEGSDTVPTIFAIIENGYERGLADVELRSCLEMARYLSRQNHSTFKLPASRGYGNRGRKKKYRSPSREDNKKT